MKDADAKRFQYLVDDSKELQIEEIRQLVQFTVSLHKENQDLKKKATTFSDDRKGVYRHWCHGWNNLNAGETFLMTIGHAIAVIIMMFSISGVFAIMAGVTDSYKSSNLEEGSYYIEKGKSSGCSESTCVHVMKEIPYGFDLQATPCIEFYVALNAMNNLRSSDAQAGDHKPTFTSDTELGYRYDAEGGTCGPID